MKQFWLQVVALMFISFLAIYLTFNPAMLDNILKTDRSSSSTQTPQTTDNQMQTIIIVSSSGLTKATLKAEIADTAQKRSLGLGGRNALDSNSGMLFLFDTPTTPNFWMKGMSIPIDIIWISGNTVIGFEQNVPPPKGTVEETLPVYRPAGSVDKVLEVKAGFVSSHNIISGDKLQQAQ